MRSAAVTSITRFPDWPFRLDSYLSSVLHTPFSYGLFDCCTFVADAILAMTGTDLAAPFRPCAHHAYRSRYTAFAVITSFLNRPVDTRDALSSVVTVIADTHALPEIRTSHAGRGDLVLVRKPVGLSFGVGIVALSGVDVLIALDVGYGRVPLADVVRAWRI